MPGADTTEKIQRVFSTLKKDAAMAVLAIFVQSSEPEWMGKCILF
jgi:hypothetical protein